MDQPGANPDDGATDTGYTCDDCDQPFKTAQGLAGHRRLAHSTSARSELEAKAGELAEREAAARRRDADVARKAEASRQREMELARREEEIDAAQAVPESERIRRIAQTRIAGLPEVTTDTVLRVRGRDYRIHPDGQLEHVYWPSGEKTDFEDGQWFRFGGRAYRISDGLLRPVPVSTVLASYLGEEE